MSLRGFHRCISRGGLMQDTRKFSLGIPAREKYILYCYLSWRYSKKKSRGTKGDKAEF